MDTIYKRMDDDIEIIKEPKQESLIQKFYAGKTVFLTGSTGFLGKALVEKILRDCPDLKCLYVLIRQKRGLSVEERMKTFFSDPLFGPLRKMYPNIESKVHPLEGDIIQEDLGLSEEDKKKVIEETHIVFHNASNVKFTEQISSAAKINVMGTKFTIDLAMKCKKVEGFMYVSTAYSHSYQSCIEEKVYPPPADMDMIMKYKAGDEAIPNGFSQKDLNNILGKFSNTYVYTKAVAEGLVAEAAKRAPFPVLIYRPAIVISTWKEPIQGWVDNVNGPAMGFIGYALGIIHVTLSIHQTIDFIPVDMAVNIIIVLMWDAIKNRPKTPDVLVYNYGSSTVKPISVYTFRKLAINDQPIEKLDPSVYSVWPHFVIATDYRWLFYFLHIVFHFIPAMFLDAFLLITGKKPMALSAFMKVTSMFSLLIPFMQRQIKIDISESCKVIARMNSVDHDLFFCDVSELDWADYVLNYWHGLRLYMLKDPLSTVPRALKKYKKLQFAHNCLKFGLIALVVYLIATRLGLL